VGETLASRLRELTLALYAKGGDHAAERDLILADTKFEFGLVAGVDGEAGEELILVDEALTPDSSRYWDVAHWLPGTEPVSFDKQYVRNWLDASGWDHQSPPPPLAEDVVQGTFERYLEAFRRLTGREPAL
jgi:phosphoribosylaminoimidazole-succinocarboxamide synthase